MSNNIFFFLIAASIMLWLGVFIYFRNPKKRIECRVIDKQHEKPYIMGGTINSFSTTLDCGNTTIKLHVLSLPLYKSLIVGDKGWATFRGNFLLKFERKE